MDTDAPLAIAREAWPLRAAEELRSARIFRALWETSRSVLPAWSLRFRAVAHDELGHARLCATIGAELGAQPPRHDRRPVLRRLASLPEARLRTAALLLVEVAIGETVSMPLFRAGWRGATEPRVRAALKRIAADEAHHLQLGWDGSFALWPTLTEGERAALWREARSGLRALEEQIALPALRYLERGGRFQPELAGLGVLDPEVRAETFYGAVERVVLPRLEELGLDGQRAWRERYRAA